MRSGFALALVGLLATACAWSPVQTSPGTDPRPLPDLVRVHTTSDSIFAVRAPTISGDTLRGQFRTVTRPPFMHETGPSAERAIPMATVEKMTAYKVTTASTLGFLTGVAVVVLLNQ